MGHSLTTKTDLAQDLDPDRVHGPIAQYHQAVAAGELLLDSDQVEVLPPLQQLYLALTRGNEPRRQYSFATIRHWLGQREESREGIAGIYLWGDVGRGKTHLMDLFYESLEFEEKLRLHFHRFMTLVHEQLDGLVGHRDPLRQIAKKLAERTRVLCLDEFHVTDIGDAMILARLLSELFDAGTVVVMTSNITPDRLYENGLQRARFLPAIELIKASMHVIQIGGDFDYRRSFLKTAKTWFIPPSDLAERSLLNSFHKIAAIERHNERTDIIVNQRRILVKHWADGIAWFDFDVLCETPRAATDYAEIGQFFHTVMISAIPVLDDDTNDTARRFIALIDELYERRVKLLVSAEALPSKMYQGQRLKALFKRTVSRLEEMQSESYFARPHLGC